MNQDAITTEWLGKAMLRSGTSDAPSEVASATVHSSPSSESSGIEAFADAKTALVECQSNYVDKLASLRENAFQDILAELKRSNSRVARGRYFPEVLEFAQLFQQILLINKAFSVDIRMSSAAGLSEVLEQYTALLEIYIDYATLKDTLNSELQLHFESYIKVSSEIPLDEVLELPLHHLEILSKHVQPFVDDSVHLQYAHKNLLKLNAKLSDEVCRLRSASALKLVAKSWNKGLVQLIIPGRRFVKEGTFLRIFGSQRVHMQLLLFSDILAIGVPEQLNRYKYRLTQAVPLEGVKARGISLKSMSIKLKQSSECGSDILLLQASTPEEMEIWVKLLTGEKSTSVHRKSFLVVCSTCKEVILSMPRICVNCYGHMCSDCSNTGIVLRETGCKARVCQACSRPNISKGTSPSKSEQSLSSFVELIETEQTYVSGLRTCWSRFCKPLIRDYKCRSQSLGSGLLGKVNEGDNSSILVFLSAVRHILRLNQVLLRGFRELQRNWSSQSLSRLASIFIRYGKIFKIYSEYASCFAFASDEITRHASENKDFRNFIGNDLSLFQSLLITPIQRCPRYTLLLKELAKGPEHSAETTHLLGEAVKITQEINSYINEHIREREQQIAMYKLEADWGPVVRGRVLVHQGDLLKVSRRKKIEYRFLLFTDCLVYGKQGIDGAYRFRHHRTIPLSECMIEPNIDENDEVFIIHAREKSFKVIAGSQRAKQE